MRLRCRSLSTMTRLRHSRLIDPFRRSTHGFCPGDRGDVNSESPGAHVRKMIAQLRSVGIDENVIVSGTYTREGRCARLVVANSWHYDPYQVRLQAAQALWELWASIHSPRAIRRLQ